MAAYTTPAAAANYIGTGEQAIKDEWIVGVSALIDTWRGNLYPPYPTPFTERVDGAGGTVVFLDTLQVASITSVTVNGTLLDAADYALYAESCIKRIQPTGATYPVNTWPSGVQNIEVSGKTKAYSELLVAAAHEILLLLHTRKSLDGLLRIFPARLREYTDGGGAVTGHDDMMAAIVSVLQLYLPRPTMVR